MILEPLQLTQFESSIVARSSDAAVTRWRMMWCVVVPLGFIALLLSMFWQNAQPRLLLWLFLMYIVIVMAERISYGSAVLAYKSVVRKLIDRVDALEGSAVAEDSTSATPSLDPSRAGG